MVTWSNNLKSGEAPASEWRRGVKRGGASTSLKPTWWRAKVRSRRSSASEWRRGVKRGGASTLPLTHMMVASKSGSRRSSCPASGEEGPGGWCLLPPFKPVMVASKSCSRRSSCQRVAKRAGRVVPLPPCKPPWWRASTAKLLPASDEEGASRVVPLPPLNPHGGEQVPQPAELLPASGEEGSSRVVPQSPLSPHCVEQEIPARKNYQPSTVYNSKSGAADDSDASGEGSHGNYYVTDSNTAIVEAKETLEDGDLAAPGKEDAEGWSMLLEAAMGAAVYVLESAGCGGSLLLKHAVMQLQDPTVQQLASAVLRDERLLSGPRHGSAAAAPQTSLAVTDEAAAPEENLVDLVLRLARKAVAAGGGTAVAVLTESLAKKLAEKAPSLESAQLATVAAVLLAERWHLQVNDPTVQSAAAELVQRHLPAPEDIDVREQRWWCACCQGCVFVCKVASLVESSMALTEEPSGAAKPVSGESEFAKRVSEALFTALIQAGLQKRFEREVALVGPLASAVLHFLMSRTRKPSLKLVAGFLQKAAGGTLDWDKLLSDIAAARAQDVADEPSLGTSAVQPVLVELMLLLLRIFEVQRFADLGVASDTVNIKDIGVASNTASTGVASDTASTGVASDTASIGDASDTASIGDASDTASTGVASDTASTGVASDTASIGDASDTASIGDASDTTASTGVASDTASIKDIGVASNTARDTSTADGKASATQCAPRGTSPKTAASAPAVQPHDAEAWRDDVQKLVKELGAHGAPLLQAFLQALAGETSSAEQAHSVLSTEEGRRCVKKLLEAGAVLVEPVLVAVVVPHFLKWFGLGDQASGKALQPPALWLAKSAAEELAAQVEQPGGDWETLASKGVPALCHQVLRNVVAQQAEDVDSKLASLLIPLILEALADRMPKELVRLLKAEQPIAKRATRMLVRVLMQEAEQQEGLLHAGSSEQLVKRLVTQMMEPGGSQEVLKTLEDEFRSYLQHRVTEAATGMSEQIVKGLVSQVQLHLEGDICQFLERGEDAPCFVRLLSHSDLHEKYSALQQELQVLKEQMNPDALVELAREKLHGSWSAVALRELWYYISHRVLPLADLVTDGLLAAELWRAGGVRRERWFWVTVTFMVLPYAILSLAVTARLLRRGNVVLERRIHWWDLRVLMFTFTDFISEVWLEFLQSVRKERIPARKERIPVRKERIPAKYLYFTVPLDLLLRSTFTLLYLVFYSLLASSILLFTFPTLVVMDVMMALFISPGRPLQSPFWATYEQLKVVIEGFFEALPQALLQVTLMCTGILRFDSTVVLSVFTSIVQAFRHFSYLKEQARANRTNILDISWQLLALDDPSHPPFLLLLRVRAVINFQYALQQLSNCKEVSDALVGNSNLQQLVFRPMQITQDGMSTLLHGLVRAKGLRKLAFIDVEEEPGTRDETPDEKEKEKKKKEEKTPDSLIKVTEKVQRVQGGHMTPEVVSALLKGLDQLKQLHELQLAIHREKASDVFKSVSGLDSLRHLALFIDSPTDSSNTEFLGKTHRLKKLELHKLELGKKHLKELAENGHITSLTLSDCKVDLDSCLDWAYQGKITEMHLLRVELTAPDACKRLSEKPPACAVFVLMFEKPGYVDQVFSNEDLRTLIEQHSRLPRQPRLMLVGESGSRPKQSLTDIWGELKRAVAAAVHGLAFIINALSMLISLRIELFRGPDVLLSNARTLTSVPSVLAIIQAVLSSWERRDLCRIIAINTLPPDISPLVASAVCAAHSTVACQSGTQSSVEIDGQAEKPDTFFTLEDTLAPASISDPAGPTNRQKWTRGLQKWRAVRKWSAPGRMRLLLLHDNGHGNDLDKDLRSAFQRSHLQHLSLRSNAFTWPFFAALSKHMAAQPPATLDLIANSLDPKSLFKLMDMKSPPMKSVKSPSRIQLHIAREVLLVLDCNTIELKSPQTITALAFHRPASFAKQFEGCDPKRTGDMLQMIQSPASAFDSWDLAWPHWFSWFAFLTMCASVPDARLDDDLDVDVVANSLKDDDPLSNSSARLFMKLVHHIFSGAVDTKLPLQDLRKLGDHQQLMLVSAVTYNLTAFPDKKQLRGYTGLEALELSWNNIGPEGARALAVALTPNEEGVFNTSLNTLNLRNNDIGDEGAKALAYALTPNEEGVFNTSLNTLDLYNNNIGPEGAKALAVTLAPNAEGLFNTSLNTLDLAGNNIGPEGAKVLAVALTPNAEGVFNMSLNTLDLAGNKLCGLRQIRRGTKGTYDASGIVALANALAFNKSLNTLHLSWNSIGPEGAKALAIALTPNEEGVFNGSLNTLDLRGNNLGGLDEDTDDDGDDGDDDDEGTYDASGIKALAEALVFNGSLNTLNLEDSHLCGLNKYGEGTYDASGIKALAEALVFNTSLNTLNLNANGIGPEGAKALAVALTPNFEGVFNGSLNTLNLIDNEIRDEGAKALAVALTPNAEGVFNTSLNTLNLRNNDIGDEGAEALAYALTPNEEGVFNTSLNTLHLAANSLGNEDKAMVQKAVRKHPNAATFELEI
ncbi:hypothetical protein CYMTET_45810 [Cymbomonas tetramitiformis]|uniref:Uncharacterized protein n=1 Tax=Cymbomonas tetramitiformis TaxID=36881 RepID=A0AAE0EY76_9CHLO|nr:hypothetical protein CYMTET_45810 [Cymbomonas tetramitiformis]